MKSDLLNDRVLGAVQQLEPIARDLDLSMAQLALAWVLRKPEVTAAIIGASRPDQVIDNVGASGVKLNEETLRRIDEITRPVALG